MKKIKNILMLFALVSLASCSSDDNGPTNLAENATGSYAGYTNASSAYFSSLVADNQTVTITSSELNKVNISYQSDTWGTLTIDGAVLAGSDGNILISGTGKSVMGHAGNAANEYDCSVEGVLAGKELSLTYSCPAVMGGLKIEFKQGEIPADIVVPGTYKGYTEAKSTYFNGMMADNQQVTITENPDNTYKIEYTSDTWGKFLIENASATFESGRFIVKGNGTTEMGMNGNVNSYDCSIVGSIDPGKESPEFTFSVPAVMGGLKIDFHIGDMPVAE